MKKTLNILQLVNVRWYNACAHYAVALSSALQKRGHQVIVAGDINSPPLHMADKMGLETFSDLYLIYQNPSRFFYNLKRLSDLIEEKKNRFGECSSRKRPFSCCPGKEIF